MEGVEQLRSVLKKGVFSCGTGTLTLTQTPNINSEEKRPLTASQGQEIKSMPGSARSVGLRESSFLRVWLLLHCSCKERFYNHVEGRDTRKEGNRRERVVLSSPFVVKDWVWGSPFSSRCGSVCVLCFTALSAQKTPQGVPGRTRISSNM